MTRSVAVVLAVGLTLICTTVAVVLAHSPLTVAGTNPVPSEEYTELEKGPLSTCQAAGTIPRGTSAVRIGIEGHSVTPAVTIRILTPTHALIEGRQAAGLGPDLHVTVHVKRFANRVDGARICTTVQPLAEPVRFYGRPKTSTHEGNELKDALLHMEYLRPGPKSWWSLLPSIVYHMGLGHTPGGASSVIFTIAFMLGLVILASRLILKELR